MIAPVGAITATGLVLLLEQPFALLGVAVLAAGLVMVLAPIVIQVRSWSPRKDVAAIERIVRFGASAGFSLTFVIGAAFLTNGARGGLYWLAADDIACLVAVALNSRVLMIEILR